MILMHRAALNGVQLDELDGRILCTGIEEQDSKNQISTVSLWGGTGTRVTGAKRDTMDIIVKAGIWVRGRNMTERAEMHDLLNSWAAIANSTTGAWLTVGHRENRRIRVMLAQAPAAKDLKNWTQEYQITLRAPWVPYWEENSPGTSWASGIGSNGAGALSINGNKQTVVEAELYNASGMEINTATIEAGGKSMSFNSLNLAGGETLVIDHSEVGLLRIRIRNTGGGYRSAMSKRTVESADDLLVNPGYQGVNFRAQRACRASFWARGRFL